MKNLALFLSMCVLLSFVTSFDSQEGSSVERSHNCKNPCEGCQNTVYSLKFNNRADCNNSKCSDTVNYILPSASKFKVCGAPLTHLSRILRKILKESVKSVSEQGCAPWISVRSRKKDKLR
jgi:hypothetical protein